MSKTVQIFAGKYEVIKVIGEGASGRVYLVKHKELGSLYALKLLDPTLALEVRFIDRFKTEAEALRRFNHPGSVQLRDFGRTEEGLYYMAMDFCAGQPLKDRLIEKKFYPVEDALKFGIEMLSIIEAAHKAGIIHRDIKPENLMIEKGPDGSELLRILDFGIARIKELPENTRRVTLEGASIGTPQYMSPEQAAGEKTLDHRVDIYSAGVVLYEILSGQVPLEGKNVVHTLLMQITQPAPAFKPSLQIPPYVERLVLKAWLAQPSVFFRRELLEQVKRPDGRYLDEDLFFCMDFDLWARMAAAVPFHKRLDKILSYYRIYDANKTGKHPIATQHECGRVFRRYSYTLSSTEQKFSFVIPAASISAEISNTLTSIAAQNLKDFEILFVDYAGTKEFTKQLRDFVLQISSIFNHNSVRFIKAAEPNLYAALNSGIEAACALVICTLQEGDTIGPDFLVEASEIFVPDCMGFALPLAWKPELKALLYNHEANQLEVKIGSIFKLPYIFPNILARKVAMMDVGGLQNTQIPPFALRDLIARVCHKSWAVSVNNSLSLNPVKREYTDEEEFLKAFHPYINAKIMADLAHELDSVPFAKVRLENGITFGIPDVLLKRSQELLKASPPDWHTLSFVSDWEQLDKTCREFPDFAPAWYFVARTYERKGEQAEAEAAWKKFNELRATQWD